MLKIYNAYANHGEIKIEDYIEFSCGKFDTGLNGFGQVQSGNYSCTKAHYELQELKNYKKYLQSVKCSDGYVLDFILWNPVNLKMLEEKYKDVPKDFESYYKYSLNEEAILLFTNYITLNHKNDNLVQRIFGRYPDTGMYLVMPDASFEMICGAMGEGNHESYEVLQSKTLGRRLILAKMDRKI